MAESAFEGRSKNFAVEMLRTALHDDGICEIWVSHSLERYSDDQPQLERHLKIKVNLEHYRSIEAECWVFCLEGRWCKGVVQFHQLEGGTALNHRPKMYFRYHPETGMVLWSRTTVVVEKTDFGYTASIQGEESRYRIGGKTDYEAFGRLVELAAERLGISFEVAE